MLTFKEFLNEIASSNTLVLIFGRMNPPTIGHEKLLKVAQDEAKKQGADFRIYLTKTQDKKKNPLTFDEKRKILLKRYSNKVVQSGQYNTIFDVLVQAYSDDYKEIILVAGSDRVKEFEVLINKYNCKEARHGIYCFDKIRVKSAGERDPDKDDVSGISATKVREYALNDDFENFKNNLMHSDKMNDIEIKKIMGIIKDRIE